MEVVGNTLPSSKGLTSLSCDEKFNLCREGANLEGVYNGPLNSAVVIRGNRLSGGQGVSLHGTTSDVVVEWNTIHNGAGGFMKNPIDIANTTDHVFSRCNIGDA